MKSSEKPIHPGAYVRQNIIPSGMSVKAAAERIGVGRPALSNFLNGRSSISPEMAARLEKAFGADQKKLLDMQASYDLDTRIDRNKEIIVRSFVPDFLTIKAVQIESWANTIDARELLPVLLRKLIHSTGNDIRQIDFPGYDNAQRRGSDGLVESGTVTPWIPEGKSYWEFGTNKDPSSKAESDYSARLKSIDPTTRAESTFVFVTPRNWFSKTAWEQQKSMAKDWRAVRAFDASDLEQWLEQSVPAQIWMARQLHLPDDGFETLDYAWNHWANVCEPHLSPLIFASSIAAYKNTFKNWIENSPRLPFVVSADSKEEALAFLACLFDEGEFHQYKDLAAIFTSSEILRKLVESSTSFIPIVCSTDVECELGGAFNRFHCIVFHPRNMSNAGRMKADIVLDLPDYNTFKLALSDMGIKEEDIDMRARESGRSPTVLRRLLSINPAIRTPAWAGDDIAAKALVPIALIGTWHTGTKTDCEIVSHVAGRKYEEIESDVAGLLQLEDSPIWSEGLYHGVVSKIDAVYAINAKVTSTHLDRFFEVAENVLSELDPAIGLPEKDRWAAAIYNKKRHYSNVLRTGICETLIILAIYGNDLFESRLGIDVESRVSALIHKLLTPLTMEKLLSYESDLPYFAEAAPDRFLEILEEDLRSHNPIIYGLLKPVDSSLVFTHPSRSGLLWALECLAWKPGNLVQVSNILADLAQFKITDNWANKPDASLHAIFRSWMPQTAASQEQRGKVLAMLAKSFPNVGWDLCIEQINRGHKIGMSNYRPHWRSDASGAGQIVKTYKEIYDFACIALKLLLDWSPHTEKTLGDLVKSLQYISEKDAEKVWALIDDWSKKADEAAKAELRETIRQYAFTRQSHLLKIGETNLDRAHAAYDNLCPHDVVIKYAWLFANQWIQESLDETEDENFDWQKREEKIDKLRNDAITEIWTERGFNGVRDLLSVSDAAGIIGHYAASCVTGFNSRVAFIRNCLLFDGDMKNKVEWCLQGFLNTIEEVTRIELLRTAYKEIQGEHRERLFICAPFQASTWRLLDNYEEDIRKNYWKNVIPSWGRFSPEETNEIIDCFLEVERPRAAFSTVHLSWEDVETSRLKSLLYGVATVNSEPEGHFQLNGYDISEALDSLDGRVGVTPNEMAQLEYLFLGALHESKHGIPNLENQIADSPELFVQFIVLVYKRNDEGQDPAEWRIEDPERRAAVAEIGYRLLGQIKKIPGTDGNGHIDIKRLTLWLTQVRQLCSECARSIIGDQQLGQLLAKAPPDENGMWPCDAVCEVMENIKSQEISTGFSIGVYNDRGIFSRSGEGGEQERMLAENYHAHAKRLQFSYPFVAKAIEDIAQSYERDAKWEDTESNIKKRLLH